MRKGHRDADRAGLRRQAWRAALLGACVLFAAPAAAGVSDNEPIRGLDLEPTAFRAWLPRALAGDPWAQYELGRLYAEGPGRPEDFAEAARWFRRAAEQGHARAQNDLAVLYGKGLGVPQDYLRAYLWFDRAAQGFGQGLRRDQALELRDIMGAFLTPEQRAAADRLARIRRDRPR